MGYDICNNKGISPGQAKTEVIANWPSPTSIREIRGFIGLTSFFRRSIPNFSVLSASLSKLIRKDSGYTKGPLHPAALESFQKLKAALISKPCLAAVDFNKRFYLTCDASATHYGACLSQKDTKGNERPCAYASKLLNDKEAKQAPGIRQRNALLFAMRHFHPYLVGKEFTVRTDYKPNLAIQNGKTKVYDSVSDEIMRYMPFKLEYLNGAKMFADILSRPPGNDAILTTLTKTTRSQPTLLHCYYRLTIKRAISLPTIHYTTCKNTIHGQPCQLTYKTTSSHAKSVHDLTLSAPSTMNPYLLFNPQLHK